MPEQMTHRERVLRAISHQEADRVPMDLGGHSDSSIHVIAYENLKDYLGIKIDRKPPLVSKIMQDVMVDEEVLDALDIDVRGVYAGTTATRSTDHDEADDQQAGGIWVDEWGVKRIRPEGSYYYDVTGEAPLGGEITIADIVNYPWPDPDDPKITLGLEEQIDHWKNTTDCAIVCRVPSPFIHVSQYVRGFEDWFMDLAANQTIAGALFDAILETRMASTARILDIVGPHVDVIMTGDDMGTQGGPQFSPATYRKLIKPRQQKFFELVHSKTPAKMLLHSCGSIYPLINDLIEIGVDILNPIQRRAANMAPEKLKAEFGGKLVFWGGIDIQEVMPFGSPDDVRDEVKYLFETLGDGGGWVLSCAHNILPEVPPENIVTLFRDAPAITRRA